MAVNKYYAISLLVFIVLSVYINHGTLTTEGYHSYIDWTPRIDLTAFKEDFTSIYKSGQFSDLDDTKRIVINWIFLIVDYEQFDIIRFAGLTFLTFIIPYHFLLKLMEKEKYKIGELEKHAIAFAAAFFYMVNPLTIEHFIAFYPQLSYALFPAAFYLCYMTFKSSDNIYPILLGALSCFLVLIVLHNIVYLGILGSCSGLVLVLSGNVKSRDAVLRSLKAVAVFSALGLFTALPILYNILNHNAPSPGYINSLGYVEHVAENARMLNIMTLDSNLHFWPLFWDMIPYPFGSTYYLTMGLMAAIVLAAGLYYRNALATTAALNFAVFCLLTNGIHSPVGELYQWAVFNIKFGWLIRSSPKFSLLLPLFFSLLLAHFFARIASKGKILLAAGLILVLLHQSIFVPTVWSLDEKLSKGHPNPEFFDVMEILKNDETEWGRVWWYGDYPSSVPIESMDYKRIRYLVDNQNPLQRVSELSTSLEIEYVLVDRRSQQDFVKIEYADGLVPKLKEGFEPIYEGNRLVLFKVDEDFERIYMPKAAFLLYAGYDSVHAISKRTDIGDDIALIMGDETGDIAARMDGYADVIVLDSRYIPVFRMDNENIIPLGGSIKADSESGWGKNKQGDGYDRKAWEDFAKDNGLPLDQLDFGMGLAYTKEAPHFIEFEDVEPIFSIEQLRFSEAHEKNITGVETFATDRGKLMKLGGAETGDYWGLTVKGYAFQRVASACWIEMDFYDFDGEHIDSVVLAEDDGNMLVLEQNLLVPEGSDYFRMRFFCHAGNYSDILVMGLEVEPIYGEPNIFNDSFVVEEAGMYEVYIRALKNPEGGSLGVGFNGNESVLSTKSDVTGFEWVRIYSGHLQEGANNISIMNIGGLNAVNIGYYTPLGSKDDYLEGKGIMYIYEGEGEFHSQNAIKKENSEYSNGLMLSFGESSELWSSLPVYEERRYYLEYEGNDIEFLIDDEKVEEEGVMLGEGEHTIRVSALSDNATLDYLVLYDEKARSIIEGIEDGSMKEKGTVEYERTGRTSYIVEVNSTEPGLLVFTAGYNPTFVAYMDGAGIRPIPVYSVINAFPINGTGRMKIEIKYSPQEWFEIGLILSGLTAIVLGAYLVKRWMHG